MKYNTTNILLLIAFVALPLAGLLLHLKLHPDLTFLTYILWFDIIVITLLYLFDKTIFYGFALNSVFFATGVVMHLMYVPGGGISDILISIPDFSIGYVLWIQNRNIHQFEKPLPKKSNKSIKNKPLKQINNQNIKQQIEDKSDKKPNEQTENKNAPKKQKQPNKK